MQQITNVGSVGSVGIVGIVGIVVFTLAKYSFFIKVLCSSNNRVAVNE